MRILADNKKYISPIVNGKTYSYFTNSFLAETEAIFARAAQEGFVSPSLGVKKIIDDYIKALINNGVWNKLDCYFEGAYNDTNLVNFANINWRQPYGLLASPQGGLTYTTSGWRGNGVDGWLNTNYSPSYGLLTNFTLNNASLGATVYEFGSGTATVTSLSQSSNQWFTCSSATNQRLNSTFSLNANANLGGTGFKIIIRDDSMNMRLYNKDVELIRTQQSQTVGAATHVQALFKRQEMSFGNVGASNLFWGASLSASEVADMRAAYNNYLIKIGLTAFA